jgi:hypothetical protein
MEELFALRESLMNGDIDTALAIVEELEDMGRDALINQIYNYAVILLLHLIKQRAEKRLPRSWEFLIGSATRRIQRKNKRRKTGGHYLSHSELQEIVQEAWQESIDRAAIEAFEGRYEAEELAAMVDRSDILNQALTLIEAIEETAE